MTSMESRPAFSAMVLGITSRALAKEFIINWVLPAMERAWCLKYLSIRNTPFIYLDSSISMAPPPETMAENFMALLTTMMESLRERSASWMN